MVIRITTQMILLSFLGLLLSCSTKENKPKKTIEKKKDSIPIEVPLQNSKYHYVANDETLLYGDTNIDYTSTKIDTLDFLEPVEIIEKHETLTHTYVNLDSRIKELKGFVCKIRTLDAKEGYIFSEFLRTNHQIAKYINVTGLDEKSISKHGKFSKGKALLQLFNSFDSTSLKTYYYTTANRLSVRKTPSLNGERITILKYMSPLELVEDLPSKKEIVNDVELGKIRGNWCKVKLLNKQEGYVFNGYLSSFENLSSKSIPKGIEPQELLINGKLKTTTTLNRFLEVMGKPDSIKYYKVVKEDFSDKINRTYKNGILYIQQITPYDYFDYGGGGWIYDDVKMKFYYKNGVEYEELNGEVSFADINFSLNNNHILYNGFKIDSTTTLKTITQLFPIQSIQKFWRYNDYPSKLYEFGVVRNKNSGSEINWQLFCDEKARSFNVYWYD
ncbi:SH3 domain-containing protein [Tenacibaculum jejuense]|nr:SH3 domain-containing protein [Tenacibaculum jejuense]